MNKNQILYIGEFPPPYGGVTVKNKLICDELKKYKQLEIMDLYECKRNKKSIGKIFGIIFHAYLTKRKIIYGFGSYKRLQMVLPFQMLFGGTKSLNKSKNIVMGGYLQNYVEKRPIFARLLMKMNTQYVETEGMKRQLEQMGFTNIEVFPNPKSESGCCEPTRSESTKPLRLVFFSQISKEKGVEDIIELVRLLDESKKIPYQIDFYGHVVPQFKEQFEEFVYLSLHVEYKGVFDATNTSVYQKLNEYDILLFPTHWDTEGVPGILVEAKMAGIAVIASDRSFNREIVQVDKGEGFLLKEHYSQEMLEIIRKCAEDRKLLYKVKQGSYQSRKRYAMEEYEDMLMKL